MGFFEAQSSQMSPHPPGYVFRAWSRRPVFCVFCPRHEDPLRLRKSPLSSCINRSLGKQQQQNLIQISFRFSVEGSGVVWVMVGGHWILWIQWIVCVINFRRRKNILHLLNRHFERVTLRNAVKQTEKSTHSSSSVSINNSTPPQICLCLAASVHGFFGKLLATKKELTKSCRTEEVTTFSTVYSTECGHALRWKEQNFEQG